MIFCLDFCSVFSAFLYERRFAPLEPIQNAAAKLPLLMCLHRPLTSSVLCGLSAISYYQELSSHWLLPACLFFKHHLAIFFGLSFFSHLTEAAGGWLPVYLRSFVSSSSRIPFTARPVEIQEGRSPAVLCLLLIIFPRQLASLSFIGLSLSVLSCLLLNRYALWATSCLLQNFVERDSWSGKVDLTTTKK